MKHASTTDRPSAARIERSAMSTLRIGAPPAAIVASSDPGALKTPRQTGLPALTRMSARWRAK
jgi:hypothetical protein